MSDERLPELRDTHERPGIPREPLPSPNGEDWPPKEVKR